MNPFPIDGPIRNRDISRTAKEHGGVSNCIASHAASQAPRLTEQATTSHTHTEFIGKFPDDP
jgi:hypothetical protein